MEQQNRSEGASKPKKKRVLPKLHLEESHQKIENNLASLPQEQQNFQVLDQQTKKQADKHFEGSVQSTSSVRTIPIQSHQINIEKEMSKIAPIVSDKFYVSEKFQDNDSAINSMPSEQSLKSNVSMNSVKDAMMSSNSNMSVDQLSNKMTVMHIDNSQSSYSSMRSGSNSQPSQNFQSLQSTQLSQDYQEEQKRDDEEMKSQSSEGPMIKGNKQLSVEVKLSDLIRYGALGQGASGYVEKVVHKLTKKIIALKVIPLQSNDKVKKQILLELKTLHECDCDCIVRSYGAFLKDGMVHIALEYMDAGSLADVIKEVGQVPEQIIGMITIQILRGLEYLHKTKKVIHRDIKPSNILLNKKGQVKIADFGVSGQMENTFDCMSSWVGTVLYMSPERLKGESYFSDTDIWSLGLVLMECALGKFPYPYENDPDVKDAKELGFWELMKYITLKESPQLPAERFSVDFRDFIAKCLRKQGGTRASASDLLKHPFVTKYEKVDPRHLRKWIRTI